MSRSAGNKRLRFWLKLGLTLGLLWLLLYSVDAQRLFGTLRNVRGSWLAAALGLLLAELALKSWKWLRLIRVHEPSATWFDAFRSLCVGVALATLTPSSVGEVARGGFLPFPAKEALVGKSVLDKCIELYCVCSLAAAGVCLYLGIPVLAACAAAASPAGMALLPLVLRRCREKGVFEFQRFGLLRRILQGFAEASGGIVMSTYLLSLLFYLLYYTQVYVMFLAFGARPPLDVAFFFPVITLSTILPLTIGGVGVREGMAILLLERYAIPGALIFNAYFLLFVIDNVLTGLCGLALLPTLGKRR